MRDTTIHAWMTLVAESVKDQRDYLTQLDAAIGDGDHGVNMDRGFDAVGKALAAQGDSLTPGKLLTVAGKTLVSTVGGASGPLWGTAFRRAGRALGDREELDGQDLVVALQAALDGVVELGAAQPGDKTMVDALGPAIDALSAALDAGEPLDRALAAATPGRRGGSEGHGAAPGPQGPRLLSRRALDRPPGPGRHVSRAHHGRAPAGGRAGGLMSERVLRGAPASPGLAAGHARILALPPGCPRVHRSPRPSSTPRPSAPGWRSRARPRSWRRIAARPPRRAAGIRRRRSWRRER